MSDYLDPNNAELLRDFFEEAQLQIDLMEQNVLVLENDPSDKESVDELFRAAHTLKGGAATVQMDELAQFTHIVEDVLDEVRSDNIEMNATVVDIILPAIDVIKLMLAARTEGDVYDDAQAISEAQNKLKDLLSGQVADLAPQSQTGPTQNSSVAGEAKPFSVADEFSSEYEFLELFENAGTGNPVYRIRVDFDETALMNTVGGIQVYSILKNIGVILKTIPDFEALNEDVFHPSVSYFITTSESVEYVRKRVTITDVTVGNDILELHEQMVEGMNQQEVDTPEVVVTSTSTSSVNDDLPISKGIQDEDAGVSEIQVVSQSSSKAKKSIAKKDVGSSILRVDSRKIDNLLNMVSEAVINKSTINKVMIDLGAVQTDFVSVEKTIEYDMRSMIETIPDLARSLSEGKDYRDIVSDFQERLSKIVSSYSQFSSKLKKSVNDLKNASQKLSINTGNLQEGIMKIRMVPISSIFSRFPRLIRDLSHSLGKQIELVMEGEDTELDKSVIEDLLDPLIHIVRNSVDHGIELPSVRSANGKSAVGTVKLRASNEGSMILIEISDDGAGIDTAKVLKKAVERGLIPNENALNTDTEIFDLLYEPGFSTASQITNVSGRGVGMDVVKTQIEKLKGNIIMSSTLGKGTKTSIRLPLTLAIIQGLLVQVGNEVYSIPATSVIDSHRINKSDIKFVDSYEVFNVRDEVIFLVRLEQLFQIQNTNNSAEHSYVVIVGSEERKIGLVVDRLLGEEDVVIKPLRDDFSNTPGIAGATILGDGKVSLIIDVTQLLDMGTIHQIESRQREGLLVQA